MALKQIITSLVAILTLSACATPPAQYTFDKSRTYEQSKDKTWESLMEYFTEKNIPIKNIEKDSGIVYSEQMIAGIHTPEYADCGQHGLTQIIHTNIAANVFVKELSKSRSKATANVNFTAMKQFGNHPPIYVNCNSKGVAEQRILDALE